MAGLNGVLHIRDNFIVFGKGKADYDKALENLLHQFQECGLTFSPKKSSSPYLRSSPSVSSSRKRELSHH